MGLVRRFLTGPYEDDAALKPGIVDRGDLPTLVKRDGTEVALEDLGNGGSQPFNGGTITDPLAIDVPVGGVATVPFKVTADDQPNASIFADIGNTGGASLRLEANGNGSATVQLNDDTHDGAISFNTVTGLYIQPRSTLAAGVATVEVLDILGNDAFVIRADGGVVLPTIPTSDPHVAGQLWANAGVLTVSAG